MEYKLRKAYLVVDALNRKGELASITTPNFVLSDRIKEGMEHDPQAKSLGIWHVKARHTNFGSKTGFSRQKEIKFVSLSGKD